MKTKGTMSKNWKPTNEQIDCLQNLIDLVEDEWGDVDSAAYELLDDLKKLKCEKPKDGLLKPIVEILPDEKEYDSPIKCYNTPLYEVNHQRVHKPKMTDSMRKDMRAFLKKL